MSTSKRILSVLLALCIGVCLLTVYLPVAPATAATATPAIAAGLRHTLALLSDGTVWAWGNNVYGQLGNSSNTNSPIPVQVSNLTDVIAIAAGDYYSLALKSDGTVYAWGRNNYGQLGDGTDTVSNVPVQVKGVGGSGNLTDVIAIAAGSDHSLALKSDGTVYAWGYNDAGQLGDGTSGAGANKYTPVQVLDKDGVNPLTNIKAISGGYLHTLALTTDGDVYAWGWNYRGQLGDGTGGNETDGTDKNTPVQVLDEDGVNPLTNIKAISGGYGHSLALASDGTVWAWGYNAYGQLGDGTSGTGTDKNTPVQVLGLAAGAPPVTITTTETTTLPPTTTTVSSPTTVPTTVTRSATTTVRSTVYNDIIDVVTSTVRTTVTNTTTAVTTAIVPSTVTNTATATMATTIPTTVISATTAVVPTTVPTTITATVPTEVQRTATITNTEIEKEASNFPWWLVVLAALLVVALVLMVVMYARKS